MAAAATTRHAPILWAQRDNLVLLTIELDEVKVDELTITPTSFKFRGSTKDTVFETSFDFHAEVKADEFKRSSPASRYIELAITKKDDGWWPRLLKEKTKAHWLKVDFNKWKEEDESDGEGAGFGDLGGGGGMPGGMPGMPGNFDLSQYMSQMGGGGGMDAPDLGDFDDEDGDEMPDLEDDEEEGGAGTSSGHKESEEKTNGGGEGPAKSEDK